MPWQRHSRDPQTVLLSVHKDGPVPAADIKLNQNVEIVNSKQAICTLDKKKKFEMELEVKVGRGFCPGDENKKVDQCTSDRDCKDGFTCKNKTCVPKKDDKVAKDDKDVAGPVPLAVVLGIVLLGSIGTAQWWVLRPHVPAHVDAAASGHLNIQHGYVGPQLIDQSKGFVAISRFGDHFYITGPGQELADAFADYGMIIGKQNANRFARHSASFLRNTSIVPHWPPVPHGANKTARSFKASWLSGGGKIGILWNDQGKLVNSTIQIG